MLARLLMRLLAHPQARSPTIAEALELVRNGRLEEAESVCMGLATDGPHAADATFLCGLIAQKRGDVAGAIRFFAKAVRDRGSEIAFRVGLARALMAQGDAAGAREHLSCALEIMPADHDSRPAVAAQLARALGSLGEDREAEAVCRSALGHARADAELAGQLALHLERQARVADARTELARHAARSGDAAARIRRALTLPAIYESSAQIDAVRAELERDLDTLLDAPLRAVPRPETQIGLTPFFLAFHARNDRALLEKLARVCRRAYRGAAHAAPTTRVRGSRLRVGFVSSFFYAHSIARTTIGLIRDLPRERFEVSVFSISPRRDAWANDIAAACDRHVELADDLEAVRASILESRLDVLVFADIGMHPTTYFLAFSRLAPLQLLTWGHPSTSGIDTIDAFISAEALEAEGADAHYSERLVRLPAFYNPGYRRPQLARAPRSRAALGLPESGALHACLQNMFKLHPDFDAALRELLELDEQAQVLLLEPTGSWPAILRRRMKANLGRSFERVRFLPRMSNDRLLEILAVCDSVLDPFHFGGNNTTCEAFALGIPIVTLPAAFLRGRYSRACYLEMGIEDCIARTPADYARIAARLGREPDFRDAVRARIAERSALLYGRSDAAHALADAIESLAAR